MSIIDTASNQVKEELTFTPRGFRPEDVTPVGIRMTRDGRTAYVALGGANHVAVVDVPSRKVRDYILTSYNFV